MITGHGDNAYEYGGRVRMDFSSNVYGGLQPQGLKQHLRERMDTIDHYPKSAKELLGRLAKRLGVPQEALLLTNGATEAIYQTACALSDHQRQVVVVPTFSEYADACKAYDVTPKCVSELGKEAEEAQVVWLCCPNNPTGSCLTVEELSRWCSEHPEQLLIVDQSYAALCLTEPLTATEALQLGNVVLLRSMTKCYAIPGLRLGYAVVPPKLRGTFGRLTMPWNVNALALEAADYILNWEEQQESIAITKKGDFRPDDLLLHDYLMESQRLRTALNDLPGYSAWPTVTNFMLVNIGETDCHELCEWLVSKHGILIRKADNFVGLDQHYIRVAAQRPDENDALVSALRTFSPTLSL